MNRRCETCGVELLARVEECPLCAEDSWKEAPAHPSGAPELGQYAPLGWKPGDAMQSVKELPEGEQMPSEEMPSESSPAREFRRGVLRTGVLAFFLLALALIAARVSGVFEADGEPIPEPDWPGLHVADRLAELRDVVPAEIPRWRPDLARSMRALEASAPEAVRAARKAHRPLPLDAPTAHDLSRVLFDRLADASAPWALWLGRHPHPDGLRPVDDRVAAGAAVVLSGAHDWCALHPASEAESRHERHDRGILLSWVEWWRHDHDSDGALLEELGGLVSTLRWLDVVACCPDASRDAALAGCLRDLPAYVTAALDRLREPDARSCTVTADVLRADAVWLRGELAADEARPQERRDAASAAAEALDAAADRLASWPGAPRLPAAATAADQRDAYFSELCAETGGRYTPRVLFDIALEEMRAANRELVRLWEQGYDVPDDAGRVWTPSKRIDRLRRLVPRWVDEAPEDPGVVFHSVEDRSTQWGGLLYAPGPRAGAVPSAFVATEPDLSLRGEDGELQKRSRQHLAAHETYPGHHLQHLFARQTCELRSALASTVTQEGWATYAEDLIHETGGCSGDAMDRWVRGQDRLHRAIGAAFEILHACGEHTADELAAAAGLDGYEDWTRTIAQPGASTPYVFGRREIERLRREAERGAGRRADPRGFHRRLLSRGPIPIPLLAEELGLGD